MERVHRKATRASNPARLSKTVAQPHQPTQRFGAAADSVPRSGIREGFVPPKEGKELFLAHGAPGSAPKGMMVLSCGDQISRSTIPWAPGWDFLGFSAFVVPELLQESH